MADAPKRFDVAISFAKDDEPLALRLRELLQPPYEVFVYSKAQEHLAGRDGVEVFRAIFRQRATLSVVLFQAPWGDTPYTRLEETAIKELGLEVGWDHVMFARLSARAKIPTWVPKPHIYLDLSTYGLADLVGAIKTRLLELGIELKVLTPADRAAAHAKCEAFDDETRRMLEGTAQYFAEQEHALLEAIKVEARAVAERTGWEVPVGPGESIGGFIVSARGQGLQIVAQNQYANTARETKLHLREYDSTLIVAQTGYTYHPGWLLDIVRSRPIDIRRLQDLGWCWEMDGRILPCQGTAAAIVNVLLDRIEALRH